MDSTTLDLLTRDGPITVTFTPALTVAQAEELATAMRDDGRLPEDPTGLASAIRGYGQRWNRTVVIDGI
jgi:hypothetical protein